MGLKTFYYKVVTLTGSAGDLTLQDYLHTVYETAPKPSQRKQKILDAEGADSKERNVIAYRTEHQDMSCGVLQHYKEGAPMLVSVHSDDDDNYPMVQVPPPVQADAKKKAEFVKHLLYFAVRGNHVVYIQSRGVGSEDLESHFNWLLSKFASHGKPKDPPRLFLEDNVPPAYRAQAPKGVKSVVLYSEPEVKAIVPNDTATGGTQTWSINDDPLIEGFLALLRKWRPGAKKEDVFKLEDAFRKGTLKAKVVLDFRDGGKSESSPLDSVIHSLRHAEGLRYDMTLPHEEPLKSVDSKITRKYSVSVRDELIIPESAFGRMAGMLEELVKANDILPDP